MMFLFAQKLSMGMSADDLEVSRHRISAFLSSHTAYELLPESGKVIALDVTLPVKQAFHILYEQGIPVAPLWDFCKGQFVGVLTASDFILILRELGTRGSNLTEEELETHTISAWKEGKAHLSRQIDDSGRAYSKRLIHAGPYDSLKDVASNILQNSISTVPILHSSAQDGSFPQLLHLASLSGNTKMYMQVFQTFCWLLTHSSTAHLFNSFGYMGSKNWGTKQTTICYAETKCFSRCCPVFAGSSQCQFNTNRK
ncbi:hypothetical protein OIU77_003885 [Salix suchowensis]|uniref:CBS domain-containing protein n=1 Tax=Salix suchowensis TaxID=1278906 RepID=A0ABQ9AU87_9ROSI|nr:hypothetical protein OIU77_003885 [Salix suchowensis]